MGWPWLRQAKRDLLRRGSPSFRVGVWLTGAAGALAWIYIEERKKPLNERVLFLPAKREIPMDEKEIQEWNKKLSGGKLLSLTDSSNKQQQQQLEGVEALRAKVLASINQQEEKQQQNQQQQQGWLSSLLGFNSTPPPEHIKTKKVPLLFDK